MNGIVRQIQGIHSNAVPTGLLLTVTNTDIEVLIITVGQLKWLRSFSAITVFNSSGIFFFTEYRKIQISEFHILFRKQTAACEQQCPQYCGHYDFPLSPFDFHPSSTVKTSLLHIYVKKKSRNILLFCTYLINFHPFLL